MPLSERAGWQTTRRLKASALFCASHARRFANPHGLSRCGQTRGAVHFRLTIPHAPRRGHPCARKAMPAHHNEACASPGAIAVLKTPDNAALTGPSENLAPAAMAASGCCQPPYLASQHPAGIVYAAYGVSAARDRFWAAIPRSALAGAWRLPVCQPTRLHPSRHPHARRP